MRILIADKLTPTVQSTLLAAKCQVTVDASLKLDSLQQHLIDLDPHVLVVRSTKVQQQHLKAAPSLSLVIRAGAGVNTIDLDAASKLGIYIANCPGKNAVAVAELTMGHLLNADRRISDNVSALRAGKWAKKQFTKGCQGLKTRSLGIIGMGSIGQEVAKRANAFDMTVFGFDPFVDANTMKAHGVAKEEKITELAAKVDALSVHLPLNDHTREIINQEVLQAMKPGALLINTSRGPIVDEQALKQAIEQKGIRAGLDVFCNEPNGDGDWLQPLAQYAGVYGTHHIGASTAQASEAVGEEVGRIITHWMATGAVLNCVNLAKQSHASHLLVIRHEDAVGVLADILDKLRRANINVQEMENIIFKGAFAACARIQIDQEPTAALLQSLENDKIFAVDLVTL